MSLKSWNFIFIKISIKTVIVFTCYIINPAKWGWNEHPAWGHRPFTPIPKLRDRTPPQDPTPRGWDLPDRQNHSRRHGTNAPYLPPASASMSSAYPFTLLSTQLYVSKVLQNRIQRINKSIYLCSLSVCSP